MATSVYFKCNVSLNSLKPLVILVADFGSRFSMDGSLSYNEMCAMCSLVCRSRIDCWNSVWKLAKMNLPHFSHYISSIQWLDLASANCQIHHELYCHLFHVNFLHFLESFWVQLNQEQLCSEDVGVCTKEASIYFTNCSSNYCCLSWGLNIPCYGGWIHQDGFNKSVNSLEWRSVVVSMR